METTTRGCGVTDENGGGQDGPAPTGPVPDLGFFAGPPTARTTFGGSPHLGAPPPAAAPPAPSRFGTAPHLGAPAPTAAFGAPPPTAAFGALPPTAPFGAPAPAAPFGGPSPAPPAAPPASARSSDAARIARRVAAPLVVLVVLGAFGVGRFSGLLGFLAGDLELPATVQGMPRSTEAVYAGVEREVEAQLEDENSGDAVVGTYADGAGRAIFVVAQRTEVNVDTTSDADKFCPLLDSGLGPLGRPGMTLSQQPLAWQIGFLARIEVVERHAADDQDRHGEERAERSPQPGPERDAEEHRERMHGRARFRPTIVGVRNCPSISVTAMKMAGGRSAPSNVG